jgi:hypothetical protein
MELSGLAGDTRGKRTICLIILVHVDKWIDVDVTMEMYARPCTRLDARCKWLA